MNGDLDFIKSKPTTFRYTGAVVRLLKEYAFVALYNTYIQIFLHRDICTGRVSFDELELGDRLVFTVRESTNHPGMLCAGRPHRPPLRQ